MGAYIDSTLLDKAILFATKAHKNVERRGKGFPYIAHPLEAMSIVATMTNDQELLAAACLHDVIEDTDITYDEIKSEFGKRVADLVLAESDKDIPNMSAADSWVIRKQLAMDHLSKAPREVKMVALGDKLSNMRALYRDYHAIGDALWNRFHVTDPRLHAWHYRGLASALSELKDTDAYREFTFLIDYTFTDKYDEFSINKEDNIIYVKGFLDRENTAKIKDLLSKQKEFTLDFTDVYNINFSGLRMLINLVEEGYRFFIRNVSFKVAHRLEVSGLSSKIIVLREAKKIDLSEYKEAGDGHTSLCYFNNDDDSMIKLYYDFMKEDDIVKEKRYATSAILMGIPTPICGDIITVNGKKGLMFEKIKGKISFSRALANDPSKVDELAKDFATMSRKLHSTLCDKNVFPDVKTSYFEFLESFKGLTSEQVEKVRQFIVTSGDNDTCVHGDYHLGNAIMSEDHDLLFIDMSDFSYGNPCFDLGTLWFITHAEFDKHVEELFHCSHALLKEFYDHFVKYYFDKPYDEELDLLLRKYSALTVIHFAAISAKQSDWMKDYVIDNLVKYL